MEELEREFQKIDLLSNFKVSKIPQNVPMTVPKSLKTMTTVVKKRTLAKNVVELSLSAKLEYSVGDSFSVIPENSSCLVSRLQNKVGYYDEIFKSLDLQITKSFLRSLAELVEEPYRKRLLYISSLAGKNIFNKMRGMSVLEVLDLFPCKPPLDVLKRLPLLKPRFYSISQSSTVVGPDILTFSFNITGVCTTFLDSLEIGDRLEITPRIPPISFGLKTNCDNVLLIANGTGVAPFIGFIQELVNKRDIKVKLIYGYREDRLYSEELDGFLKAGVEIIEAVSGRGGEKKYVQDFVRVDDLDSLIYVCGSGVMGRGLEQVLINLLMKRDECTLEEAIKYWREDRRDTYLKEIWG